MELFLDNFANWDSLKDAYPLLLQGLWMTILLSIAALPVGIALGLLVGVVYSFHIRWLNRILIVYIDLCRSFPIIVLLVLIFYGLPFLGITLNAFVAVIVALGAVARGLKESVMSSSQAMSWPEAPHPAASRPLSPASGRRGSAAAPG